MTIFAPKLLPQKVSGIIFQSWNKGLKGFKSAASWRIEIDFLRSIGYRKVQQTVHPMISVGPFGPKKKEAGWIYLVTIMAFSLDLLVGCRFLIKKNIFSQMGGLL